ncbi:MAG: hypothetical protein LIQ31_13405, partial [Planctomycetes bacterium]|nr:hypothetical protein [Planctomycetota bacterium]
MAGMTTDAWAAFFRLGSGLHLKNDAKPYSTKKPALPRRLILLMRKRKTSGSGLDKAVARHEVLFPGRFDQVG